MKKAVMLVLLILLIAGCTSNSNSQTYSTSYSTDILSSQNESIQVNTSSNAGEDKMTNEKTAQNGDTVKVHYTGRLKDGTVFDSSEGRDPLQVTLGSSMVIPGFNDGILNMKIGEKKTVEIPVDQAYGPVDPMRFMNVEPAELPGAEVGRMIQANNGMIGVITEVYPDRIVVDFNHQLAGKDLIFEIELVEIA